MTRPNTPPTATKRSRALGKTISTSLALFALSAFAASVLVGPQDYAVIKAVSEEVRVNEDPRHAFVLGIGRSPTPIIAYEKERYVNSAANFPFSAPVVNDVVATFDPKQHAALMRPYFDKYLPTTAQLKGRRLHIVDYTISGGNLLFFTQALKHYLAGQGRNVELTASALSETNPQAMIAKFQKAGIPLKVVPLEKFGKKASVFTGGLYKPLAEFPNPEEVKLQGKSLLRETAFDQLREKISEHMADDASLPEEVRNGCKRRLGRMN